MQDSENFELSVKIRSESYINWNHCEFATVFLAACKFTMRFIPLILAAATVTLFNVYAHAKPVTVSRLDNAGHLQLEKKLGDLCPPSIKLMCEVHCELLGCSHYICSPGYVQIPSNRFVLRLTI